MVTLLVILAVLGILFGAAALATYEGDVLRDPHPDDRPSTLPTTALQPEDVSELRFDMAVRGYRMSEVDETLQRVAQELADRDARIAELEDALSEPQHAHAEVPAATPVEPAPVAPQEFAPIEPAAAAPAVASGPLTATTWWTDDPTAAPEPVEAPAAELVEPVEDEPAAPEHDDAAPPEDQTYEAPEEQSYEAPVEHEAYEETAALDVPASLPEPPALTLPASDEAFSFPELTPPEPAVEEPVEPGQSAPEKDWWTSLQEPPSGGGPGRG